jgi:ATP-dependent helicase/nuclease subunit B
VKPLTLVPFSQDPLAFAAQQILEHYQARLPDLSDCRILVAEDQCAAQFRAELLVQAEKRGFDALLGPTIERLDQYLNQLVAVGDTVLNRPAQELVLAEALRDAAPIYVDTDPWLLAEQLLCLFDELTRRDISIPTEFEQFHARLQQGYALSSPSPSLQQEAYVLHTLWHAWVQQLQTEQLSDPASAYRQQLTDSLNCIAEHRLWLIGFTEFTPSEAHWLRILLERQQAQLILHGSAQHGGYHPDRPIRDILDQLDIDDGQLSCLQGNVFDDFIGALFETPNDDLKQRAQRFAERSQQDPTDSKLSILQADDPEQEAQAVALQIRRWLLDGIQPIAIVTEDRRLARRVRAMLEASRIELDDAGGWALSTTSAAATLERWLETVEEDFACGPLLDVLKSPFVCFSDRDTHLALVRRLEQDIILHENVARGLQRYRYHLDSRSERLPDWSEPIRHAVQQMLNRLDHSASPLMPLLHGSYAAKDFLDALNNSLRELGSWQFLEQDAAGQRLLDVLAQLQRAATYSRVKLQWSEFRSWLGRNLENATFRLALSGSPVRLLTLEQSRLQRFAATIVAGCNQDHMPGAASVQAFFNQRVRAELGLPTWSQLMAKKLHHFCRLLHSAERILLTHHRERDGEPVGISPWLELLQVFYHIAYGKTLDDRTLRQLVTHTGTRPVSPDRASLPPLQSCPAPKPPASVHPKSWSVYTHQRLIDCPYRYFSADALSLKPQDEIREALSKSDYGSLIHRIVQAFHSNVARLPGPWCGDLQERHREQALTLLKQIGEAVFADAVKDNFQARSWLKQWLTVLPDYLDWEINRQKTWSLRQVEVKADRKISSGLRISGRIDRIDQCSGTMAVTDYKTGKPPKADDVSSGEAVQLSSYALLLDARVAQLNYLEFGKDQVREQLCADTDSLQQLLPALEARMVQLDQALQRRTALPAWGDARVCSYCEFSGLCRREMWLHAESGDD